MHVTMVMVFVKWYGQTDTQTNKQTKKQTNNSTNKQTCTKL